jgi:hypothetical protein
MDNCDILRVDPEWLAEWIDNIQIAEIIRARTEKEGPWLSLDELILSLGFKPEDFEETGS